MRLKNATVIKKKNSKLKIGYMFILRNPKKAKKKKSQTLKKQLYVLLTTNRLGGYS
jgi:hypothetical protein